MIQYVLGEINHYGSVFQLSRITLKNDMCMSMTSAYAYPKLLLVG